tara:strand:+ start:275 stop:421 length:147 start_codon:yes stop_codon:yes gene_type:complete
MYNTDDLHEAGIQLGHLYLNNPRLFHFLFFLFSFILIFYIFFFFGVFS